MELIWIFQRGGIVVGGAHPKTNKQTSQFVCRVRGEVYEYFLAGYYLPAIRPSFSIALIYSHILSYIFRFTFPQEWVYQVKQK